MEVVNLKRKLKNPLKILIIISILLCAFKYGFDYVNQKFNNDYFNTDIITEDNNSNVETNIIDSSNDNKTILERLNDLSKVDKRINQVIKDYDKYPEQLLDMLSRNIEMLDYVLDFSKQKGKVSNDYIENFSDGIPLLLQWDKRWGYGQYGENYIAISGCGPTSLAMVIVGLTHDLSITPYKVSQYSEKKGYYINGSGTSWNLMTDVSVWGIKSREISLSKSTIFNALQNNHPIICSMRKGDFTTTGHFIVLVGIENGKIKVNDPNSKSRSNTLWSYDRLQGQIKNLWEFYL